MQIPEESKALRNVQPSQESTAAVSIDEDAEEEKVESNGAACATDRGKIIDQRASNVPIVNPDLEDLKELLQQTAKQIGLKQNSVDLLMKGIETNKFKQFAEIVSKQLESNKDWERAAKLRDVVPLFEPH